MPENDICEPGRTDLEIAMLSGLISRVRAHEARDAGGFVGLLGELSGYIWAGEEHRVVYECLRSAQGRHVVPLREQMAAEATRMGHPDVDWDLYFQPSAGDSDLAELIRRLKHSP
ncbi:MAG TPA: hypothetical protein VIY69_18110 [Candidatus Acidoferrales bacterium]